MTGTLFEARAIVTTPPQGAAIQIDINQGATCGAPATGTIFTGNAYFTITQTAYCGVRTSTGFKNSAASFVKDEYFSVDIVQVGSTVAGSGLAIQLRWTST